MDSKSLKDMIALKNAHDHKRITMVATSSTKRKENPSDNMSPPTKQIKTEHPSPHAKQNRNQISQAETKPPSGPTYPCNHCGGTHRETTATCPFLTFNHEHVNKDANIAWEKSKFYDLYKANPWVTKHGPQIRLRHDHTLLHNAQSNTYSWKDNIGMPGAKRTQRGNYISNMSYSTFLASMFRVKPTNTPFLTFSILPNLSQRYSQESRIPSTKRQRKSTRKKEIDQNDPEERRATACLIDTGALDCSYIGLDLAKSIVLL